MAGAPTHITGCRQTWWWGPSFAFDPWGCGGLPEGDRPRSRPLIALPPEPSVLVARVVRAPAWGWLAATTSLQIPGGAGGTSPPRP